MTKIHTEVAIAVIERKLERKLDELYKELDMYEEDIAFFERYPELEGYLDAYTQGTAEVAVSCIKDEIDELYNELRSI